jgi:N-acylneuraminate cytidylyltransferase
MWQIDPQSGHMLPLLTVPGITEPYNTPRQLLPAAYLQTGHANAIRPATILRGSMTGQVILPIIVDAAYDVDLDAPADWERGEWWVSRGGLEMIWPDEKEY